MFTRQSGVASCSVLAIILMTLESLGHVRRAQGIGTGAPRVQVEDLLHVVAVAIVAVDVAGGDENGPTTSAISSMSRGEQHAAYRRP